MKVLLDTRIFLWLQTTPERLGRHLSMIESPSTDLLVSVATGWQIAIRTQLGKLGLPESADK